MSASAQLCAAFPHLDKAQIEAALWRCGGDPNRAVEVLLTEPQPQSGGNRNAHPRGPPPSIHTDPQAWFRHFDTNGNGLEQHEVIDAVAQTFNNVDRSLVQELIGSLWPLFDTDGSGTISMREFIQRDGLRDTLLAQLGATGGPPMRPQPQAQPPVTPGYRPGAFPAAPVQPNQQTQAAATPSYRPGVPAGGAFARPQPQASTTNNPGYRPGAPVSAGARPSMQPAQRPSVQAGGPAAELQEMFPDISSTQIKEALARCRGDKAAAADRLARASFEKPSVGAGMAMPVQGDAGGGYPTSGYPMAGHSMGGYPMAYPMGGDSSGARPTRPSGRVPKLTGRRRAVLVGINYFGTQAELRGCINDVRNMHSLLTETYHWPSSCFRILTDDNSRAMPTRKNIESALSWLVEGAQPGDVLFFHFSGHGAQQEDPHGYEEDGMNETILPVDFKMAGMMTDDHLGELIVRHLPEGVRLTAVMDCCHSGTGLDLPYTWTGRGWKEDTNPYHTLADVQMFSGCADDDTSSDASNSYGAAGGAMTTSFCDVLRRSSYITYPELMAQLNQLLYQRGFSQHAQLTSSQCFDFQRPFILDDIIPNSNATTGRTFRRKFPPQPRPMSGPLADMLGLGAALVGGMVLGEVLGDVGGGLLGALFG